MLLQIKDGFDPNFASMKLDYLKYLVFKTLDIKDLVCWIILRLCFAIKTWLKLKKSRNPNPPLIFV